MFTGLSVSREEYLQRIQKCREMAAERGFDALVVTGNSPNRLSNLRYLANYRPWLGVTPTLYEHRGRGYGAIVIPFDSEPILIASSTYYEKENVVIDKVVAGINVPKMICDTLNELGLQNGNIGLVGEDILYVTLYKDLHRYAPGINYVFCDDILLNMRKMKSPVEIEILREGAHIGHLAALEALEVFHEGNTEQDMVDAIEGALTKMGVEDPWSMCQSGVERSSDPLRYPYCTDRVLKNGDLAFMEIMGSYKGYFIDLTRAGVVGKAKTKGKKQIMDVVFSMGLSIAKAAKPGITAEALQLAAVQPAIDAGLGQYSIIPLGGIDAYAGHGLGLDLDEPPVLSIKDKTVLQPGVIMAIEPALYRTPYGGCRIERNILITETGSEILDEFEEGWW